MLLSLECSRHHWADEERESLAERTMAHEFDGKKYEQASEHQKEWGNKLIGELNLKTTDQVLDLGCGDGLLTAQIAELVPRGEVLGVDASQGMIDAAVARVGDNLRFLKLDINDLDFADRFDVVFSNAALHWIKNHTRLLEKVSRALRANGRVRFNFAGEGNCAYFFKVIREAMVHPDFSHYFKHFEWPWYMPTVQEYRRLATTSQLREVQVWGENEDRFFPDEDALVGWVDQPSIVPFLTQVADWDKESFRSFVVRRMIEETRQSDGRCFETFRRINLSALK